MASNPELSPTMASVLTLRGQSFHFQPMCKVGNVPRGRLVCFGTKKSRNLYFVFQVDAVKLDC